MKLLFDFFPIVLFFVAYKLYGIYIATTVAIAATFVQIGAYWLKNRTVEKMHLVTLALITILGGATLFLHDPIFIKWKPTLINWAFAIAFLVSNYVGKKPILRRMMDKQITLPTKVWNRLNFSWASFFAIMGVINLFVVYNFDTNTWVNFKLFGMLGLTVLFVIIQAIYLSRHIQDDDLNPETKSQIQHDKK